jgi:adenosylmethionine-8-amino-7-oxononanoate aminotransferase
MNTMNTAALDAFWMPFTPNRQFKAAPKLVVAAEGVAYRTADGRELLDGASGLWRVGAGHRHPRIAEAQALSFDQGVLTRAPGDTLVPAPPFISTLQHIDRMVEALRAAITATAAMMEANP